MKKLLILMIPILLWSCEKTNKDIEVIANPISNNTMTVSNETIKIIAINNIIELNSNISAENTKSNDKDIQVDTSFVIKDKKGRNAINIFKYKDKKGWNIISGDNRFNPILAYNGSGEARLDTSLNPGLKFWIEDILKRIEFMDNNEIMQSEELKFQWDKYSRTSTPKRIPLPDEPPTCTPTHTYWAHWNSSNGQWEGLTQLEWNQTAGFNHYMDVDNCDPSSLYCDKYPAGCGPVAMGMLMHYYQKPVNYEFGGNTITIDYDLMPLYIYSNYVTCYSPTDSQREVSALIKYVAGKYGHKLCTTIPLIYNGTSFVYVYSNDIMQTFNDWGYSNSGDKINYYDDPNHTRLINNLKLLKPVIFYGKKCDLCFGSAHYWLAEGLHQYTDITCATHRWLYMNWGLGIGDNGWFTLINEYSTIINGEIVTYDNAHMKIYVDINP